MMCVTCCRLLWWGGGVRCFVGVNLSSCHSVLALLVLVLYGTVSRCGLGLILTAGFGLRVNPSRRANRQSTAESNR